MLLPMICFLFFLIVIGGIISVAAVVDPHHKRSAPLVGFPILFAGICALILSFGLAALGGAISLEHQLDGLGFFGGYALGVLGGGFLGYRMALRHRRHLIEPPESTNDSDEGQ